MTSSPHAHPCNCAHTTALLHGLFCFPFQHLHTPNDISQHICAAKKASFGFFPGRGWGWVWPWAECHCSKLSLTVGVLFSQVWAQDLWFGKAALQQLMQHSVIFSSHGGFWFVQVSAGTAVLYTHTHNILLRRQFCEVLWEHWASQPPKRQLSRMQVLLQLPAVAAPAGTQ